MSSAVQELDAVDNAVVAVEHLADTPAEELPDHVREHYDAIREKEREVRGLESNYFAAKEEAGIAKKEFELADKALRDMIARGSDPQLKLPLTDAPAPEAWRTAPFSELGLTSKQNELFESAGVTTIGGIEDLRAQIAEGKSAWPKGIGPSKVTDIENRIVDWLDKNRDKFGEVAEHSPAEPDDYEGAQKSLTDEISGALDRAGILAKDDLVPVHKAKSNGKAKHKANGKAKAKKKLRR